MPVRTDKPVPKSKIYEVIKEIGKVCLDRPVKVGEVVIPDILGLKADLVSTREVKKA